MRVRATTSRRSSRSRSSSSARPVARRTTRRACAPSSRSASRGSRGADVSSAPLVVGVVGAGAMGRGIAQVAAAAGHRVLLSDADAGVVDRAREAIRTGLARDVAKGRIDQPRADALLARIARVGATSGGVGAFAECGLVIEAVIEELAVKRALLAALEQ